MYPENQTKTCIKCGLDLPLSNFYSKPFTHNRCISCIVKYNKEWRHANNDKAKAYAKRASKKAWEKQKNDKVYLEKKKLYRQQTREKRIATAKAWNQSNKKRYNLNVSKSKSKRKGLLSDSKMFIVSEKEIKKLYSGPCVVCGSIDNITIDHIIPITKGGTHSIGNLQSMCRSCNSTKNNRFMSQFKHYLAKTG